MTKRGLHNHLSQPQKGGVQLVPGLMLSGACISVYAYYKATHQEARTVQEIFKRKNLCEKDHAGNVKAWKLCGRYRTYQGLQLVFEIPPGVTYADLVNDESKTCITGPLCETFGDLVHVERAGRHLVIQLPD